MFYLQLKNETTDVNSALFFLINKNFCSVCLAMFPQCSQKLNLLSVLEPSYQCFPHNLLLSRQQENDKMFLTISLVLALRAECTLIILWMPKSHLLFRMCARVLQGWTRELQAIHWMCWNPTRQAYVALFPLSLLFALHPWASVCIPSPELPISAFFFFVPFPGYHVGTVWDVFVCLFWQCFPEK